MIKVRIQTSETQLWETKSQASKETLSECGEFREPSWSHQLQRGFGPNS